MTSVTAEGRGQGATAPAYAAVLAGGQSRRFGSDKALATLHGQTLLARVCLSLSECPRRLLVAPPERYGKYYAAHMPAGWQIRAEARRGEGPLAALETALAWAEAETSEGGWLALCGVDYPLVTRQLWRRLREQARAADVDVQVVGLRDEGGQPQPMPALYRVGLHQHSSALRPQVSAWLEGGERRLRRVLDVPAVWLDPARLGLSPSVLTDADTPADLARLAADML